jgi:L-galactose dehydrogenase/L-glyceraldehyde 3-phosphate reductase
MEYRVLGKTGLRVSVLGFGCGNVGGLMIRGSAADRERAAARAIELGINYFDTAPSYGDGQSETNLGAALGVRRAQVYVGTKVQVDPGDLADVAGAITRSLEASLRRLGMDHVDLLQLHNRLGTRIGFGPRDGLLSVRDLLDRVIPELERLREEGKTRFSGITALGDTEALHRVIETNRLHTAQVCYNLLNPSAGVPVPAGFPAQDFRRLLGHASAYGVGVIVIRVLAAGALSGDTTRHQLAVPTVEPIASGPDYTVDVQRAQGLRALVEEGHVGSLVEAALRFAISHDAVSTVLLGYSGLEHLEDAVTAMARGPLPPSALDRLTALWGDMRG